MKTILLADDSPISRNLLKTMLLNMYSIIEATNGDEVLTKSKETNIDLFLMDLNMPVMNGIEATRALRQTVQYAKTPILMLTSEVRNEKKEEGKKAGISGWVVKTCKKENLLKVINQLLS